MSRRINPWFLGPSLCRRSPWFAFWWHVAGLVRSLRRF